MLLRKRVNVRTNGTPRNVLFIEENVKGDVYIRIKSGTQVGLPPNEIPVLEDRYSIHPSLKSAVYTTLKFTTKLVNGVQQTSVALTDAVKRKDGFSHLLTHRSSDLVAPVYNVTDDGAETADLGDFDPRAGALVFAIFIGHPDSSFSPTSDRAVVNTFCSQYFQIVLCHTWIHNLPALPFAWTMQNITFPPEFSDSKFGQEAAYRKMSGKSPEMCFELFHGLTNELTVNLLETYQSLTQDKETRKHIQTLIDAVPRIASIRM